MRGLVRLGDLPQWVSWCYEKRNGDLTKVPYSPVTGDKARTNDPRTWGTFTEARKALSERGYDGIGFVFAADDPFCGVDLDGCVDLETGEIESWAAEILAKLDSYTEFSPSGKGLHIIVRAELPPGGNRKGRIEMYDRGRFFTVTGRRFGASPERVEERQEELAALHARLLPASTVPPASVPKVRANDAERLTDEQVLSLAMRAANGEKFAALWSGDRAGYNSASEADLALCSMLAFYVGPDEPRIAELFSRSGLRRGKWERLDYRQRTIAKALANFDPTDFYSPPRRGPSRSRARRVLREATRG